MLVARALRIRRPVALVRRLVLVSCAGAALTGCATAARGAAAPAPVPASFVRLAVDSQTTRTVSLPAGVTKAVAWRTLLDYLGQTFTVEARDQGAGFVMTAWQASLARNGVPDLRYRTRLQLKFLGDDWKELEVRAEANWREGESWQVGVDRALLDRVAEELRGRLSAAK